MIHKSTYYGTVQRQILSIPNNPQYRGAQYHVYMGVPGGGKTTFLINKYDEIEGDKIILAASNETMN